FQASRNPHQPVGPHPHRVTDNWWRGEGHRVDVGDVADLLEASPGVLVVGMGANGLMRVSGGLEKALGDKGIRLVAQASGDAVKTFNKLLDEGEDVAGAFHLTC
ncbi:MTH938/NDUFAF3 family protein, partial [Myxococcota bacterium]